MTGSVKRAVAETERRRKIQMTYNKKHNIIPQTIIRAIKDILPDASNVLAIELGPVNRSRSEMDKILKRKEIEMKEAADNLNFELAAVLRDEIHVLEEKLGKHKDKTVKGRTMKKKIKVTE